MKPARKKIVRGPLDRLFFRLVTLGWSRGQINTYSARLHHSNASLPRTVVRDFQTIDAKATGLLTHVALMIAGLGLVAPLVASSDFEVGVVIAEIAFYLLIAVGCLRCLAVFHARELDGDAERLRSIAHNELIIRRELYGLCNRAAIVFTLLVFVLLPFLFFYRPERHL